MKIMFVCTGNICRSPLAEAVLRHISNEKNLKLEVSSSGTEGYHAGEKPDYRTLKVAQKHGISMEGIVAKQIDLQQALSANLILTATQKHKNIIIKKNPDLAQKTFTFLEFIESDEVDIADPYYGNEEDFDKMYEIIHQASLVLVEKIKKL